VRLGNVCRKIGSGATPRGGSDTYLESGPFSLIRSQNVYNNRFTNDGLAFISNDQADDLSNVEVSAGDVLLNITGDSVARCCQAPKEVLPARVNQHVAIIRPDSEELDPTFLRYFLVSPQMQDHMLMLAGAGATRNALTKGMIENFDVPKPKISEQRAIASVLGALDDKIELNRRMNETLEALAQTLFKSWFVDATANGLPNGWREGKLEDVLVLQRGFDLPSTERTPGPYPVLTASGPNATHNEFMVRGPGVTTGRSGLLGKVFYVHEDFWPLNTSLWVKEFRHSTPLYAFHLLRGLDFEVFNAGSAVPTLNRNHVHNLPVAISPMEVIQEFEAKVLPMYRRIKSNDEESRTLTALRDALLPKLLSGELRVPTAAQLTEAIA
jgi:type I restriction enzyme S subunit